MILIEGATIDSVSIVDDDPNARASYSLHVEDIELKSVSEDGPFTSLEGCINLIQSHAQAALSDYKLSVRNYASFTGAQLVAELYTRQVPAVLCTKYEIAEVQQIRPYRARIPALLRPNELNAETLVRALERCVSEFRNIFLQTRRAWRTLVRIEDIHSEPGQFTTVDVCVPSWNQGALVRLQINEFPATMRATLVAGARYYARVNTGAERHEELYFQDWEI